jgi:hypothetical protein
LADANFQATYLKIGVDYEFNIKNNIWDIDIWAVPTFVRFSSHRNPHLIKEI